MLFEGVFSADNNTARKATTKTQVPDVPVKSPERKFQVSKVHQQCLLSVPAVHAQTSLSLQKGLHNVSKPSDDLSETCVHSVAWAGSLWGDWQGWVHDVQMAVQEAADPSAVHVPIFSAGHGVMRISLLLPRLDLAKRLLVEVSLLPAPRPPSLPRAEETTRCSDN